MTGWKKNDRKVFTCLPRCKISGEWATCVSRSQVQAKTERLLIYFWCGVAVCVGKYIQHSLPDFHGNTIAMTVYESWGERPYVKFGDEIGQSLPLPRWVWVSNKLLPFKTQDKSLTVSVCT